MLSRLYLCILSVSFSILLCFCVVASNGDSDLVLKQGKILYTYFMNERSAVSKSITFWSIHFTCPMSYFFLFSVVTSNQLISEVLSDSYTGVKFEEILRKIRRQFCQLNLRISVNNRLICSNYVLIVNSWVLSYKYNLIAAFINKFTNLEATEFLTGDVCFFDCLHRIFCKNIF